MSIFSKVRIASFCDACPSLLGILIVLLAVESSVGQQPLRHIPPVATKPIPRSQRTTLDALKTNSLGFRPQAVSQAAAVNPTGTVKQIPTVLNSDTQVVRTSYESRVAPRPLKEMAIEPVHNQLSWNYELKNLSYEQFEQKLSEVWGRRLLGKSLDPEQKMLRIFFPEGKSSPEQTMTFDRVNRIATFEGSPSRKLAWHQLMLSLDRTDVPGRAVVRVKDIGLADQDLIQKVAYAVQDQTNQQDDPPDASRDVNLGNLTPEQQRQVLDELRLNIPTFPDGRRPRIVVSDDLLTITGHPDDVAKLEKFIDDLIELAPKLDRRSKEIVSLNNSDPASLAETLTQIYQEQYLDQYGPVSIIPIPSSRSLLVLGGPVGVQQVVSIAQAFDGDKKDSTVPLDEDEKGFVTYKLQFLSPRNAKRAVDEFFGISTGLGGGAAAEEPPPVRTTIEERANTITIIGSPVLRQRAVAFLKELDQPGNNQNSRVIRVYNARNQVASTLAFTISDILGSGLQQNQGFTGGNQQNQNFFNQNNQNFGGNQNSQPQTGLTTLVIEARNGSKIGDGGRAFDVRITADDASNSLAIVAHEETLPLIMELLAQLDRIPNLTSEVKVFPIYNGDANEILDTLNQIFTGAGSGQNQQQQGTQQGALQLPLQSPASDGASLLNLRFAVNERLNVIIASGSISDLEFVEALISRLDEKDGNTRQTRIYRLSNASSTDISETINSWLDELDTVWDANPLLSGGNIDSLLPRSRRDIIVVDEAVSNTLVVNAQPDLFPEIEMIIERLDRRPPVVKVKAMIVQIDLGQMENFGIEFGVQDSSVFDAGLSETLGTGFVGLDNIAGQLVSDLAVGRASPGGIVLSAGGESFSFIMRFLEQRGCAKVLFRPHVMTLENLEGRFTSGQSIQRLAGTTTTGLNVQQNIQDIDIGVTLAVTPRVSPDGMIVMFVDVTNSALGDESDGTSLGTDAQGNEIRSAPILQTGVQTAVMCRAGQTVAITGLISEEKREGVNSVPILGKLPVVGPLFQRTENSAARNETLIILTPYIVDGDDDLNFVNEDEFERMHWCREDVDEIYGSTEYSGMPYRERTPVIIYPDDDPRGSNPTNVDRQPVQQQFPGRFDDPNANYREPDPSFENPNQRNTLPMPDSDPRVFPPLEPQRPDTGGNTRNVPFGNQMQLNQMQSVQQMNQTYSNNHFGSGRTTQPIYNKNLPAPRPVGNDVFEGQSTPASQSSWQMQDGQRRSFTLHPPRNQSQRMYR